MSIGCRSPYFGKCPRTLRSLYLVLIISSLQVCRMTVCKSIISVSQSLNPTNWSQICGNSRQSWGCHDAKLQVVCILPRAMDLPMANADLSLNWYEGFLGCASSVVRDKAERGTYTSTAKLSMAEERIVRLSHNLGNNFGALPPSLMIHPLGNKSTDHRPQPSRIPRDHT